MIAVSVLEAALCFDIPASQAYGDAPWCAVYSGDGAKWDCQYRTFEECRPNVLAGNRGWCNPNPYIVPKPVGARTQRKRHTQPN
jgi:Protein of unknown function (DUF3551)